MRYLKSGFTVLAAVTSLSLVGGLSAYASPSGSAASGWHIGYYQSTAPQLSDAAAPSAQPGIASLNFTSEDNTALLVTDQKALYPTLLGDLSGKTITANFTISGVTGDFTYYGEGTSSNTCGTPASTHLYFETSNATGFDETHYWWSNPTSATLANGTVTVTTTVTGADWSDFYGHLGNDPLYSAGFAAAASHVTTIGLSFGGGCFFENGVGTTDGSGTLTLNSFTTS